MTECQPLDHPMFFSLPRCETSRLHDAFCVGKVFTDYPNLKETHSGILQEGVPRRIVSVGLSAFHCHCLT